MRPCKTNSEIVTVAIDLKLSRIVDVVRKDDFYYVKISSFQVYLYKKDEKNQIMTTDVWITQVFITY